MSIRIRFACGHEGLIKGDPTSAPICPCGETRIARTFARPPRFSGACSGPYAITSAVEPGTVNVAPQGALKLKAQESEHG